MANNHWVEDSDANIKVSGDTVRGKASSGQTRTNNMMIGKLSETGLKTEDARVNAKKVLSHNPLKRRPIE